MRRLSWTSALGGLDLAAPDGSVTLREADARSLLRLDVPASEAVAVGQAIGAPLPEPGRAAYARAPRGPARETEVAILAEDGGYLVMARFGLAAALAAEISSVLAATPHHLVDRSGALSVLVLTGGVDHILARICGVDRSALRPDDVVRTMVARTPATLWWRQERCEIIVGASRAAFVASHLAQAGRALGLPAAALPAHRLVP
ncbi:hypothetical protein L1787_12775 [Acuticoccus sp. M5D2P5]|uniref:hypothetical protein n=1 Tax=Acuticoccus kalidii TaxID=2910977 RepID=UPI001F47BCD3|nr:hypothetical protein [Acuticoccus kalidii]MCF3934283.1 hypothetical protein [Acuticoccus kalidii]